MRFQIILLLLIFYSCRVQEKNQKPIESLKADSSKENVTILGLRNRIAQINQVQDRHIGYAGFPSEQFGNYEKLLKIASDKDLNALTKDTNYTVATYAAFGLIKRENPLFIDVFAHFLKYDRWITTMKGCLIETDLVSSEIYHQYWNKTRLEATDEKTALQNDKNLLTLDSLILETKKVEWVLYERVFNNRVFDKEYLPLIEHHAFKRENIYAIEYLFKYHLIDYEEQIIYALKSYLNREEIWPIYYDKLFPMMLSFKKDELNQLLIQELKDIRKQYGESKLSNYKKILQENNIKI